MIINGGTIIQYAKPNEILSTPQDSFELILFSVSLKSSETIYLPFLERLRVML